MVFLIYISIFLALLFFKLWNDRRLHDAPNKKVNHELSAGIDVLTYTVSAWFIFGWDSGGIIVLTLGLRWLAFDILFNLVNGWKWNNYGKTARLDRWLTKLGRWHLLPKIVLIILGFLIYAIF